MEEQRQRRELRSDDFLFNVDTARDEIPMFSAIFGSIKSAMMTLNRIHDPTTRYCTVMTMMTMAINVMSAATKARLEDLRDQLQLKMELQEEILASREDITASQRFNINMNKKKLERAIAQTREKEKELQETQEMVAEFMANWQEFSQKEIYAPEHPYGQEILKKTADKNNYTL